MKYLIGILLLFVFQPAWAGSLVKTIAITPETKIELPIESKIEGKVLSFRVFSGGCTSKADFGFVDVNGTLLLVRKKADLCKALLKDGVWISYDTKEVNIGDTQKASLVEIKSAVKISAAK